MRILPFLSSRIQSIYNQTKLALSYGSMEFRTMHRGHLLNRLQSISIVMLFLYAYYVYADFVLYTKTGTPGFRHTLALIHLSGFVLSACYLALYRFIHSKPAFLTSKWAETLILISCSLYLLMGAVASLNSQQLTGNVDAYIMITIGVSVVLPIHPVKFLAVLCVNHTFFLYSLSFVNKDAQLLMSKQINTTVTAFVAFMIVLVMYSYQKQNHYSKVQLEKQSEQFRKFFEVNPFPLILTTLEQGKIKLINDKAVEFFQLRDVNSRDRNARFLYKHAEERAAIVEELKLKGSIKNVHVEGKIGPDYKWVLVNYELVDYDHERCILAGITDITELKKLESELTIHASTDTLTGVLNRRKGIELLEAEMQESSLTICFIDINNLKLVNDSYGHAEGDDMIRTVCRIIQAKLDTNDTLFRYGGDEFILLFVNKSVGEVEAIWQKALHAFEIYNAAGVKPYPITFSYGLQRYEKDMKLSAEELVRLADEAMYEHKSEFKKRQT